MSTSDTTCWTLIRAAGQGRAQDREEFARRYLPVVEAYLGARWRGTRAHQELDDAAQEIFVECFRQGGVIERADPERPGGFRAFLYGVIRNVALRVETRASRRREPRLAGELDLDGIQDDEPTLSRVFDRAWALSLLREAWSLQEERAEKAAGGASRRVELLRLRFQDGLAIREIAERWCKDGAWVHSQYKQARREYKAALMEVVSFHHPESPKRAEEECAAVLSLLR